MAISVIVNPVSGGGRVQRELPQILSALSRRFGPVDLSMTAERGGGRRLARLASDAGADLIIAFGGDGTISECADGILSSQNPHTPLAIIPAGTGSDFARNFEKTRSTLGWVDKITFPRTCPIDVGLLTRSDGTQVHVLNVASFGISGDIAASVNAAPRSRYLPGKVVFMLHAISGIVRVKPTRIDIAVDGGQRVRRDITILAIANGSLFGGGMKIAPQARLDDGLFDIIIVDSLPWFKLLTLFPLIYLGLHTRHPKVTSLRASSLEAWLFDNADSSGPSGAIEVDGESVGHLAAHFSIKPKALHLAMQLKPV